MYTLYSAPRTRSIRVAWLLEELSVDFDVQYEIKSGTFEPTPSHFFIQDTPTGKYPTLDHDGFVLMESGAIIEYLLEQFPKNALIAAPGSQEKATILKWMHYADATAFSPIGILIWLSIYRTDADQHPQLIMDSKQRAASGLKLVEERLADNDWLVDQFSAADIMMGFTVIAAQMLGLVPDDSPIRQYIERIQARPAFQSAFEKTGGFGA